MSHDDEFDATLDGTDGAHPAYWRGYEAGLARSLAASALAADGLGDGVSTQEPRTEAGRRLADDPRFNFLFEAEHVELVLAVLAIEEEARSLAAAKPASEAAGLPDYLAAADRSMAEHDDRRSACPNCGEWRDSPTADCAACGAAPATDPEK